MIPEFAILGHPNEGKSSVLSTLAEDDSVQISPFPGETSECRAFPVTIDGREILRFIDTPGFQNPRRMLAELRRFIHQDTSATPFHAFIHQFNTIPELKDDCELLKPVIRGAGIIYVVDGSRPVRNIDRAEMEILRLTAKPRMAILNCKEDGEGFLPDWRNEVRQSFNSNRLFNAHRATYAERILLLEALKNIDQEWHPTLDRVIKAFRQDWDNRNAQTADILIHLLEDCLRYHLVQKLNEDDQEETLRQQLQERYAEAIRKKEQRAHKMIRALFKHNIFYYELPPDSLFHQDLFSKKTWHFLGLSQKQMLILGALGGAAAGVTLDLATLGSSFGLFGSVGGILGAAGALYSTRQFPTDTRLLGMELGQQRLQVGPNTTIQFLFVLLDRAFLFYAHIINWAHGRRDFDPSHTSTSSSKGINDSQTKGWSTESLKVCQNFYSAIRDDNEAMREQAIKELQPIIMKTLLALSNRD